MEIISEKPKKKKRARNSKDSDEDRPTEILRSLNDSSSEMIPKDAYAVLEKQNDYDFNFCDYLKRVEEFDLEKLSYCTDPHDAYYPEFTSEEESSNQTN